MIQNASTIIRAINCVALILALLAIIAVLLQMRDTQEAILTYIQQYEIAE